MKDIYFEIYGGEDGVSIKKIHDIQGYLNDLIKEEHKLLGDFPKDQWNGKTDNFNKYSCDCDIPNRILIKGKIIVPKKKEVVQRYEIEE